MLIVFCVCTFIVCKFSNVLKRQGVRKGDSVCIYMPMIPEATIAMLACTRIGAPHSVVFAGFSSEALRDRILDCKCQYVITSDEGLRGGKSIPLKIMTDAALKECPQVKSVIVYKRTGKSIPWIAGRDVWWHEAMVRHAFLLRFTLVFAVISGFSVAVVRMIGCRTSLCTS